MSTVKLPCRITERALELIEKSDRIVITNHVNPDGDAVGSALGLALVLKKEGKQIEVIVPNQYPSFLKWMKGSSEVVFYKDNTETANRILREADLIFHLDYNSLTRSGSMKQILEEVSAQKIMIDHHQSSDDFSDVKYSNTDVSSTCEMVYHFIESLGWKAHIDSVVAECLYTGILTDTGGFKHSNISPITHQVVALLIEKGVKPRDIASRIYDTNTPQKLKLLSRALEHMDLIEQYRTAVISLNEEDLIEFDCQPGDTRGIVNYGLSLMGMVFSAFFYPLDGIIKISFRSKDDFDVNSFARKHFNGGGHKNAAGGISNLNMKETLKKFYKILPSYEKLLSS